MMRVVQLHYRRVLTALGIGFLCSLYVVGRFAYYQQSYAPPWHKPQSSRRNTLSPTQSPGIEIVGSEKSEEYLDLSIPKKLTYPTPRTICSADGAFNQQHLNGCPDYNCKMQQGQGCISTADAVIFNMGVSARVTERHPQQYYVYMSQVGDAFARRRPAQESPLHSGSGQPYAGFFNLSMGYRRDADVPCPYGYVIKEPTKDLPSNEQWLSMLKTKTKPFAWFVSNCGAPSRRMDYVNELKKLLPVDVYGGCGTLKCPKPMTNCMSMLNNNYRFYLALENSVCKGYITEKLWSQGLQAHLVPIVIARSIVEQYLPPDSFIALDDFPTVQAFAEHIKLLMRDDAAYTKLAMKWRQAYRVVFLDGRVHDIMERPWGFCRLCQLVQREPREKRIIPDLKAWWVDGARCDSGQTITDILSRSKNL